jgi:uridine kinase
MTPMLIGIAGGTGSGKSTFAEGLKKLFPNEITIISYDNYYKPQDHLSMEERVKTNYDCPDALDTDLLVKHLRELVGGKCVDIPDYDFCIHTRKSETVRVCPTPVIIVDGILTFHDERLRELFDEQCIHLILELSSFRGHFLQLRNHSVQIL